MIYWILSQRYCILIVTIKYRWSLLFLATSLRHRWSHIASLVAEVNNLYSTSVLERQTNWFSLQTHKSPTHKSPTSAQSLHAHKWTADSDCTKWWTLEIRIKEKVWITLNPNTKDDAGIEHVVAYVSSSNNQAEDNYSSYHGECLAEYGQLCTSDRNITIYRQLIFLHTIKVVPHPGERCAVTIKVHEEFRHFLTKWTLGLLLNKYRWTGWWNREKGGVYVPRMWMGEDELFS